MVSDPRNQKEKPSCSEGIRTARDSLWIWAIQCKGIPKTERVFSTGGSQKDPFPFFLWSPSKASCSEDCPGPQRRGPGGDHPLKAAQRIWVTGLKGILPIREGRSFDPFSKWEGERSKPSQQKKDSFLLDSSNLKKDYLRNRIRLTLIPLIDKEFQSNFKEAVLRPRSSSGKKWLFREGAEEAYQKIIQEEGDTLSFKFSEYQSLHQQFRKSDQKDIREDLQWENGHGGWRMAEVSKIYKNYVKLPQVSI